MSVEVRRARAGISGSWRVSVSAPRQRSVDITAFRGVPTLINTLGFSDPFGPTTATISLPHVSFFDRIGHGDLGWLRRGADLTVTWTGEQDFAWEGYLASFDYSTRTGLEVSAKGALLQHDGVLAKPRYTLRPIPYEVAIATAMSGRADLRTAPLKVEWPSWWKTTYAAPAAGTPLYYVPIGLLPGARWSGLLTRDTGSFNPTLTGYVQTLLQAMYTERGRFAIDLDSGRRPVLRHRDELAGPGPATLFIDPVLPGVELSLSEDWSQSLTTVYGQGTSLAGVGYSGMQVSPDGGQTDYRPLAALRQVWPVSDTNWHDPDVMAAEVLLALTDGLSEEQAGIVGTAHLRRFGDPGMTGRLTLGADPVDADGNPFPRQCVRAGMSINVPKLFGAPEGLTFHVTDSTLSGSSAGPELTLDSKFRDALTVEQVRLRGRDALQVPRLLIAGKWAPPIPDQLLPWNYAEGSGYLPSGPANQPSAVRLFTGMPANLAFPWESWTRAHPPGNPAWKSCYVRIGPAAPNATGNWAMIATSTPYPVRLAQAGDIRLIQVAAYDARGNVAKVPFHLSLYYASGVNPTSMPSLPGALAAEYPPYASGQHYPFHENAWDAYNPDGTLVFTDEHGGPQGAVATSGPIRGWGNHYEKAGYFPGSMIGGDAPTGLLVDETAWHFDTTTFDQSFNPYSTIQGARAGYAYAMLYCDAQAAAEVYFLGRMFRVEPGTRT